MTYSETLAYLYSATPAFHQLGSKAYKPGLDNARALLEKLGNPERKWHSVHIAGTNGKGSCSHLIAAVLQCAGYKTGLYTSPHLVDFRERIRVNGEMISEQDVVSFVEQNKQLIEHIQPSFFEITMAMAFCYFARQKVDVAVVEVGLGGRLDSTNLISPDLAVITNIGFDHTEFLGNTLSAIALEKAGIIKPLIPVVIGEADAETRPVFEQQALAMNAPLFFAAPAEHDCQLKGSYQQKNIGTVMCAIERLRQLGYNITDSQVDHAFNHVCDLTGLRGRWQICQNEPMLIFDTGHNSHGIKYVTRQLKQLLAERPNAHLYMVFGMVADKDVSEVVKLLPRERTTVLFTEPQTNRKMSATQLALLAQACGVKGEVIADAKDAFFKAMSLSKKDDIVFVGGSNYLVGELLPKAMQHD